MSTHDEHHTEHHDEHHDAPPADGALYGVLAEYDTPAFKAALEQLAVATGRSAGS